MSLGTLGFSAPPSVLSSALPSVPPVGWYAADSVGGYGVRLSENSPVWMWADLIGGKNITQSVLASCPIYKKDAMNGLPGMLFSGGQQLGRATAMTTFRNVSYYVVGKIISATSKGTFFYDSSLQGNGLGIGWTTHEDNGSHLIGLYESIRWISTGCGCGINSVFVACMTVNSAGTTATFYLNGVVVNTSTGGANNPSGTGFGVGGDSGRYLTGAMLAEVMVFNTVQSSADRALVENYLNSKYGVW